MKKSQIESGRSMVEMLGVLAIIGVLSVGGIAGYKTAMERIVVNRFMERLNLIYNAAQTANSMPGSYMQCCTEDTITAGNYQLDCPGGVNWRQEQMAELKALLPAEYCTEIVKLRNAPNCTTQSVYKNDVEAYGDGAWKVNLDHRSMVISFAWQNKNVFTPNVCKQIMKNAISAYGDSLVKIGEDTDTNWTQTLPTDEGIETICRRSGMSFRFNNVKAWEDCVTE